MGSLAVVLEAQALFVKRNYHGVECMFSSAVGSIYLQVTVCLQEGRRQQLYEHNSLSAAYFEHH